MPSLGFSFVYLAAGVISVAGMVLYFVLLGRYGRFTRHQMDRTAEAKTLVEERRQHFFRQTLAHA